MTTKEQNKTLLENRKMRKALERIRNWELPVVENEAGKKTTYEVMHGSKGAQTYIRKIAEDALSSI